MVRFHACRLDVSRRFLRLWIGYVLFVAALAGAGPLPFLPGTQVGASAEPSSVVAGDFNGDGRLDLAATIFSTDEVVWFESTGSGFLEHPVMTSAFWGPIDLASGDIDCDGDLDLVIGAWLAGEVVWARNLAGAGWNLGGTVSSSAPEVSSIDLIDLEPDGDLDVVGAVQGTGEIVRWRSDGCSGAVWIAAAITVGLSTPDEVATGDLNGDGRSDVVAVDRSLDLLAYWENPGNAGAWTEVTLDGAVDGANSVSLGDLDRDGDLDVAGAAELADELAWWENPGTPGAWTRHPVADLPSIYVVRTVDLDRDGDLDLLAGSSLATEDAGWWENVAGDGGSWSLQALDPKISTLDMIARDLDGDGDVDVASATQFLGVRQFENDSTHRSARFGQPDWSGASIGVEIADVAAGDIDGDGLLDYVVAESDSSFSFGQVSWYRNLGPAPGGGASFEHVNGPLVTFDYFESVAVGDIDEDGDDDIVVGCESSVISAWYCSNDGAGASWSCFSGILPQGLEQVDALELADIDGDSDLDLLSAVVESPVGPLTAIWWENPVDSTTAWIRHDLGPLGEFPNDMRAVDINGDGDLDVLSGSEHWWRNDGGSPPVWTARTLPGSSPAAIEVGDLDRDGDTDLAFAKQASNALGWYENDENGPGAIWIEHEILPHSNIFDRDIALADIDLDGDLDLAAGVSGGANGDRVSWFENDPEGFVEVTVAAQGPLRASHLLVGDFHLDGDPDLIVIDSNASTWDAFWNGGGPFALATTDLAPPTLGEGSEGLIFAIELHHRGRPGDAAIELASLVLRFESVPGVPLTTPELAVAVAGLTIYHDDGSGTFEAGVDLPIASLAPPPLVGGLGTLVLPDGHPDLELAFADSSDLYFLTAEIAVGALAAGIPGLVVTLDPGDGSVAEHDLFDTALAPEYAVATLAEIEIVSGAIFSDGFESQDTSAWSAVSP